MPAADTTKAVVAPLRPRRVIYDRGRLFLADVAGGSFEFPSLINIRPLTFEFFDEIKQFLDDHYEGCECKQVGAFNRALGCDKAAMMHLDEGQMYQREDWLDHFREEDVIEVPLMIALSEVDDALLTFAHKITQEHERFRRQPSWDTTELSEHAGLEDRAMLRLLKVMKRVVGRSG